LGREKQSKTNKEVSKNLQQCICIYLLIINHNFRIYPKGTSTKQTNKQQQQQQKAEENYAEGC